MENKKRIAILVPGGIGKDDNIPCLVDLIFRAARSYDVKIFSFSRAPLHPLLNSDRCTVSFLPAFVGRNKLLASLYFLWLIRKDHARREFSVVHGFWVITQGVVAVLAGKLIRVPSMISLPGGDTVYLPAIEYGGMRNGLYRIIIRWCVARASRTIALTAFQQRMTESNGVKFRRISVIPFGVDVAQFAFRPKSISTPVRFGFIGNLNRVKDPFTMVRAFSILVRKLECTLTIVGMDALEGTVEEYARKLGVIDKIQWKGKIPHEAIPSILRDTDLLILTSLFEGEAVVVMEAFAAGVIVAGSNVGLLADQCDNRVLVAPGDAEGLADKIEQLIAQPILVREMQRSNRALAEKYSAEWTWSEYQKLYEELSHQRC